MPRHDEDTHEHEPIPAGLLAFDLTEWVAPADLPPGLVLDDDPDEVIETSPDDRSESQWQLLAMYKLAERRWHAARRAWASQHGRTVQDLDDASGSAAGAPEPSPGGLPPTARQASP